MEKIQKEGVGFGDCASDGEEDTFYDNDQIVSKPNFSSQKDPIPDRSESSSLKSENLEEEKVEPTPVEKA